MPAIYALQDRIIVKPEERAQVTEGGLILPDQVDNEPMVGTVVDVGPGKRDKKTGNRIPSQLQEGDRVVFGKWSGTTLEVEGNKYQMMYEKDIFGVIKKA